MKILMTFLMSVLLSQSALASKPAIYFDHDDIDGFYMTDGSTKIHPSFWGTFKGAETLFRKPQSVELYNEYLRNKSKIGCAFLTVVGATTGIGILLNNVSLNNSGVFIGLDVVVGYFTSLFLTMHYARKADLALLKATNTENGVYEKSSENKTSTLKRLSLALGVDPSTRTKTYGLALNF